MVYRAWEQKNARHFVNAQFCCESKCQIVRDHRASRTINEVVFTLTELLCKTCCKITTDRLHFVLHPVEIKMKQ